MLPKKLQTKLERRHTDHSFRILKDKSHLVDFSSNDYLGFSKLTNHHNGNDTSQGATGSRLLSGQSQRFQTTELQIANYHKVEAALIFNSGYDANLGLLSSVLQRGDMVFFDELCHASIRDGIRMSQAKAIKFKHNDVNDLEHQLQRRAELNEANECYIITESVFSMDGDIPDLQALVTISETHQAHLIIDEAHAIGVCGNQGEGLVQELGLQKAVFARIVTYGKALGCHGASVLGSQQLKDYLINFSRPFIFTTALPPLAVSAISSGYKYLSKLNEPESPLKHLQKNIAFFKAELQKFHLQKHFINSSSAIQSCIVSGNRQVKTISQKLENQGFDVRPILSPTVPLGEERLRFCLHSYNSVAEISKVLQHLATFVSNGK